MGKEEKGGCRRHAGVAKIRLGKKEALDGEKHGGDKRQKLALQKY